MEDQLIGIAQHGRAFGPGEQPGQVADEAGLARVAGEELLRMGMPRVNLLFAGRAEVVGPLLDTLLPDLQSPIASWFPGETLALTAVERTGTLVIHEIGALGLREQIQLLEWSARAVGRAQVISTTSASLLPRIRAGAFIDILYYRLNTLYLDISGLTDHE
jgi:hypothetical protein